VQACAIAGALPAAAMIADMRIENTSARSIIMLLSACRVVAVVNRRP
jgi:hypothetical protein